MQSVDWWKRRIVRFFVFRSYGKRSYRIQKESTVFRHFAGNFDANAQAAYEQLRQEGVIREYAGGSEKFYGLDFIHKIKEIDLLVEDNPAAETAGMIRPSDDEVKDLNYMFWDRTRGRPNSGYYYFYTKKDDSDYWVVMIRTKPGAKPYKIIMGSITDKNSRISKIWRATTKVAEMNKGPFIRKWVENMDQQACGNNRLPSRAAFKIFEHLGRLEEVYTRGRVAYYRVAGDGDSG